MQGLRIFDRFGFNLTKENDLVEINSRVIKDYDEWEFDPKQSDWINTENDESLTKYNPTSQLLEILNNRVNTKFE